MLKLQYNNVQEWQELASDGIATKERIELMTEI